ncbi:MAG: VWA domain-containing protein [Myxococcales bacterium]|nr:VWA domain-containing protein [Myxococcales bacterium]MCB9532329.1 VWA domain-containing protein [Myxococcales bacterium]
MNWTLTGVSPELLGTLAAALGAVTTLLYLLRVRRRRIAVPYSPLWREVLEADRPSRLWDRLKWLLSLLVQLAILAALLLALGDPRSEREVRDGRSVVILLDTSASMTSLDEVGHRSRFERALDRAREVLHQLGPRDEALLVTVDGQLRPVTPFVKDPGVIDEALTTVAPTATAADLAEALRFAVDSLAGRPHGEIVLISDGSITDDALARIDVSVPQNVGFHYQPVGRAAGNIGITAFNVRRYPSNRTSFEVYAQVANLSDAPVTARLDIFGEGSLVATNELTLEAGAQSVHIYPDIPAAGRHLEARLSIIAGDVVDVFALDDVAYTLLPDQRPLRVLLVTAGNLYLEAPFLLNESLEVTTMAPDAYEGATADPSAGFDVTVFDRVAPHTSGHGNFLYFSPSGPSSPWNVSADVVDPIIHSSERGHPLLRWITGLRDVNVARARRLELQSGDHVVASAIGGAPMIVTREAAGERLMGVAFDVADTDFPLRVAYPVLLLNALDWFTRDDASLVEAYRTGETWFVPIGTREVTEVEVTTPSGRTFTTAAQDGRAVFYGADVGFYSLRVGQRTVEIAGNLASTDESRITPRQTLAIPGVTDGGELEDASVDFAFDPWLMLTALAFGLVLFEWITWNRRVTV